MRRMSPAAGAAAHPPARPESRTRPWALALALVALPLAATGCHRSPEAPAAKPQAPSETHRAEASGAATGDAPAAAGAAGAAEPKLADLSVADFKAALPHVDPAGLDGHQRAELARLAQDVLCPCGGKATTLAASLAAETPASWPSGWWSSAGPWSAVASRSSRRPTPWSSTTAASTPRSGP